jgi:tripartite-type tricarboxylate transporter receptor subunit TctC
MALISGHDKVEFTHVPFKGGAESMAALLGGHVDINAGDATMQPMVEAGKIRLLTVWTEKRVPLWKDVPTLRELGYPWSFDSPWGLAGPKGMDPAVVKKLHDAFKKTLDDPKVQEVMSKYSMPPRYADGAGYLEIVKQVTAFETAGVKRIGMGRDE